MPHVCPLTSKPTVLTVHPSTPNAAVRSLGVWVRANNPTCLCSLLAGPSPIRRAQPRGAGAGGKIRHSRVPLFAGRRHVPRASSAIGRGWTGRCSVEAHLLRGLRRGCGCARLPRIQFLALARLGDLPVQCLPGGNVARRDRRSAGDLHAPGATVDSNLSRRCAWADLADLRDARHLRVAMAAVIEDDTGGLSYWGLRHPPGKPDFHHPNGFALEVARS